MRGQRLFFYVFLMVPTTYLLCMVGFPVVYNVVMSVQEVNLGDLGDFVRPFVGLSNYTDALTDPTFRQVALNTLVFVVVNVIGQLGIGMLAAVCFSSEFPGASYLRGLLLATWVLPGLVVGTVLAVGGLAAVLVAHAFGHGWRSVRWGRVADALEGLCVALAAPAALLAAGGGEWFRQLPA